MKIAYIEHIALSTNAHVYIPTDDYDEILSLNYGINSVNTPLHAFTSIWEILSMRRVTVAYVYGSNVVMSALDIWAEKNNEVITYKHAATRGEQTAQRSQQYINRHDFGGKCYTRKLQIKTPKHGSTNRHARLHLTTYYAFDGFFPSMKLNEACKAYGVAMDEKHPLLKLVERFTLNMFDVTGLQIMGNNGKLNYMTMGGISKAYYLNLYAPEAQNPFLSYLLDFPQSAQTDLIFREARLLPPPLMYMRKKICYDIAYKYDKCSLFPWVEKNIPNLGNAVKVDDLQTFDIMQAYDKNYEYIIIFKHLELTVKDRRASILHSPFEEYHGINSRYIDIQQSFAIFGSLFNAWLLHYDLKDFEIEAVYRCRKYADLAIKKYVDHLGYYKINAKNEAQRKIAKNLLNFLHGKFAQLPYFETYEYENINGIITRKASDIKDKWRSSHFHFVRGAYIYAMAQAIMLKEIDQLYVSKVLDEYDIYYIDTDCIITPIEPEIMECYIEIDNNKIGAYKVEEEATYFIALSPKNYIRLVNNEIKLTSAGYDADDIIAYARSISENELHALQNAAFGKIETGRYLYVKTEDGIKEEWQTVFYNGLYADVERPQFDAERGEIEE